MFFQVHNGDVINFRIFHNAPVEDDFVADGQLSFVQVLEKDEKGYSDFWVYKC